MILVPSATMVSDASQSVSYPGQDSPGQPGCPVFGILDTCQPFLIVSQTQNWIVLIWEFIDVKNEL